MVTDHLTCGDFPEEIDGFKLEECDDMAGSEPEFVSYAKRRGDEVFYLELRNVPKMVHGMEDAEKKWVPHAAYSKDGKFLGEADVGSASSTAFTDDEIVHETKLLAKSMDDEMLDEIAEEVKGRV